MSNTIFHSFGLRENPFSISPDPRFLYSTVQTHSTWSELTYAISTRKGLILLTGEVGTGKTTLVRRLMEWLSNEGMPTALIFNSRVKTGELLDLVLGDFGVPCDSTLPGDKLICFNRWLLERYRAGQTPVLIVDEAQGLPQSVLEQIRLLLNFETPRDKLLQIVLSGQPELEEKLKRNDLRQLKQRITIRCRTSPLTREETHGYVAARLEQAGALGDSLFRPEAVDSLYRYSNGIPRIINLLCEHALIHAYAGQESVVLPEAVVAAARDCQLEDSPSPSSTENLDPARLFKASRRQRSAPAPELCVQETSLAAAPSTPKPSPATFDLTPVAPMAPSPVREISSPPARPNELPRRYSDPVANRVQLQAVTPEVPEQSRTPISAEAALLLTDSRRVAAVSNPIPLAPAAPEMNAPETYPSDIPEPAKQRPSAGVWLADQVSRLGRGFAALDRQIQAAFARTWVRLHGLPGLVRNNSARTGMRSSRSSGAPARSIAPTWSQKARNSLSRVLSTMEQHPWSVALMRWLSQPMDSPPRRTRKTTRAGSRQQSDRPPVIRNRSSRQG